MGGGGSLSKNKGNIKYIESFSSNKDFNSFNCKF